MTLEKKQGIIHIDIIFDNHEQFQMDLNPSRITAYVIILRNILQNIHTGREECVLFVAFCCVRFVLKTKTWDSQQSNSSILIVFYFNCLTCNLTYCAPVRLHSLLCTQTFGKSGRWFPDTLVIEFVTSNLWMRREQISIQRSKCDLSQWHSFRTEYYSHQKKR